VIIEEQKRIKVKIEAIWKKDPHQSGEATNGGSLNNQHYSYLAIKTSRGQTKGDVLSLRLKIECEFFQYVWGRTLGLFIRGGTNGWIRYEREEGENLRG